MRKYLGSTMTAYAAIMLLIFMCVPPVLGILLLFSREISGATVFLALITIFLSVLCGIYIKQNALQQLRF